MGFLGNLLLTAGLDVASSLLGGPKPRHQNELKDKTYSSNAYGSPWPRCRGTVRLQGKVLYASKIITSIWKTVSGGFLGIGQSSSYYDKYSVSLFVGFGKKLGGGPASGFLRIYADGKLLFNAKVSDASAMGTITVAAADGSGQLVSLDLWPVGATSLQIQTASNSSIKLNAGDEITFVWFMDNGQQAPIGDPYEIQVPVTLGANQTGTISFWPPLGPDPRSPADNHSVIYVSIPGSTAPYYDQLSFDPNPHDGSHLDSAVIPPGGINFYLGADDQPADPNMLAALGAGNVPGYRGLCAAMIANLQLANYGNRIPQFSAEIAFDIFAASYPFIGPTAAATGVSGRIMLPVPTLTSPPSPYVLAMVNFGQDPNPTPNLYRINVFTNQVEAIAVSPGCFTIFGADGMPHTLCSSYWSWNYASIADADGVFYGVVPVGLNQWALMAFNYLAMNNVGIIHGLAIDEVLSGGGCTPPVATVHRNIPNSVLSSGDPCCAENCLLVGFQQPTGDMHVWDRPTTSPVSRVEKLIAWSSGGDGLMIAQRQMMLVIGRFAPFGGPVTTDSSGHIWVVNRASRQLVCLDGSVIYATTLLSGPCSCSLGTVSSFWRIAGIDLSGLHSVDLSSASDSIQAIVYWAAANQVIVVSSHSVCRVDCATGAILGWGAVETGDAVLGPPDALGNLVTSNLTIIDVNSITGPGATITVSGTNGWTIPALETGLGAWDPITNSVFVAQNPQLTGADPNLYRLFLGRGAGGGIGDDQVVAAVMSEAGYDGAEYDVTALPLSHQGWEFDQEPYKESIKRVAELDLFDPAEIDAQIRYVPRGAPADAFNIPEEDLGAQADPGKPEPRLIEMLTQETDVPLSVWIRYYDALKQYQQATQYQKRISQPYASDLIAKRKVTNSKSQLVITSPVTDFATPIKQQADKILYDLWASRFEDEWKNAIKYVRLDPTDCGRLSYKGETLAVRLVEADLGAGFARQFKAKSYDASVYTSYALGDAGPGSGTPPKLIFPVIPPTGSLLEIPLTPNAPGDFSMAHPLQAIPALVLVQMTSGGEIWFQMPTRYDLSNLNFVASDAGVTGYAELLSPDGIEIPITAPTNGAFTIPHNLGSAPALVLLQPNAAGEIWWQPVGWDATNLKLVASAAEVTTTAIVYRTIPLFGGATRFIEIPLAPGAEGNFSVAHGVGKAPILVLIRMNSNRKIWLQPTRYDATNINAVASGADAIGFAEVWA